MAIQFARVQIVGRGSGGNACCKGAYNARSKITDEKTNITYNFQNRGDNVYHIIILPEHVDQKYKNISVLMNAVEKAEPQKNSQLLKDVVIALPDDKELDLQDRINITHEIIDEMEWVKNGLAVQVDIHKPHDGEKNWHAHLLVTTRRFTEDGKRLYHKKARDLNPEFKTGKYGNFIIPEEDIIHERGKRVINEYFKKLGLENRVDAIGVIAQEHIGPIRMRSVLNQAADRNEARRVAEIEYLSNGLAVLDKVTRHMSVFTKADLMRAVKVVPSKKVQEKLVEDALAHKSIISLFTAEGKKTQYYTTLEVRAEERKIERLAGYVANEKNIITLKGKKAIADVHRLIAHERAINDKFTAEQEKALSEILLKDQGIRLLRGRAGTGKSHTMGIFCSIAKSVGVNVIGVAPTHKARVELEKFGYNNNDTVKGMLFKLANGRFSLPKYSMIVVDEAGMVGNHDYQELLRVAATRKCNVILSGDERQQASVSRGEMFEVFVNKYDSSTILDIKRQETAWGRAVAMELSQGRVRNGIEILKRENRINWQEDGFESMQALLSDWHKSDALLTDKLIIAVKNKDVAALNHGARQYLKLEGKLTGPEIEVAGNHYMQGDRILIKKTDKELGVINGDLAEILEVGTERFVISIKDRIIEFNPSKFHAFKHGYATTIFNAQGASIKLVYVFHDGFASLRNMYVALSRHIVDLTLYVNSNATSDLENLIKQLSYDPDCGSSLNYLTTKELENIKTDIIIKEKNLAVRSITSIVDFIAKTTTKMIDKYLPKSEYYNYKEPKVKTETASEVIDRIYSRSHGVIAANDKYEQRHVAGGNINVSTINTVVESNNVVANNGMSHNPEVAIQSNTAVKGSNSFYAKADYIQSRNDRSAELQAKWDNEREYLRMEVSICAERIARDLLGPPNKRLSNGRELRYGEHGKIVVCISGRCSGTWYNFSEDKGGDMFSLVQHVKACDFKEAANHLIGILGIEQEPSTISKRSTNHLRLVDNLEINREYKEFIKRKSEQDREKLQKQAIVDKLVQRSKDITENSIASKYLTKTRGINCQLGADIKMAGVYVAEKNRYLPAIIAYARNEDNKITGGVQIILKANGCKADIDVPKKSFGRISGSFVDLGRVYHEDASSLQARDKITVIAEGIETALSVKQALSHDNSYANLEMKILCSLGINNIGNYKPACGERIIIASDNDGEHSITDKTIDRAKAGLEEKKAYVETVRPDIEGDFNDVLKLHGEGDICRIFRPAIEKHIAVSLNKYLSLSAGSGKVVTLTSLDQENLAFVQKYNLSEKNIVENYRQGEIKGSIYLDDMRKSLEFASFCYKQNKDILLEAKRFGCRLSESDITKAMIGMNDEDANSFCEKTRNTHLENYLEQNVGEFTKQKKKAIYTDKIKTIIIAEQKFLKEAYESLKVPIHGISSNIAYMIRAGEVASKQPELLNKVFETSDYITSQCKGVAGNLYNILSCYNDMDHINTELLRQIETYKAFGQPFHATYERATSKTIESVLVSIRKEQNILADLNGNIDYHSSNKELMSKVQLAYTQRKNNDFDKLEVIVQKSLEIGVETEETLLKKLQHTTDLKETYNKLDQAIVVYQINSRMVALNNQISKSQTADDILKALDEKKRFLINLDKNIKYPELHKQLLELGKLAKISYLQQVPEKLNVLVKKSLSLATFSEQSIVDELKHTKNIEKTCQKFQVAIDVQVINKSLLKLNTQKQAAKTLAKVMATIKQEQEFLGGLHGKIKHSEYHSDNLINSIKNAHDNMRMDKFDKLSKLVTFLEKNTNDHITIINTLKSTNDLTESYQSLLKSYKVKCISSINKKISVLDAGKTVTLNNKKFDCPIKFLDYLTKTRKSEYFPHKEVQKIQSKVIENHKQLELSKSKGPELEL